MAQSRAYVDIIAPVVLAMPLGQKALIPICLLALMVLLPITIVGVGLSIYGAII